MTTWSKMDDLRARSMCVCDFAYLVMKICPHCNFVLMYQWWLQHVCVRFCILCHEDMAALSPCFDVSLMTIISVCVCDFAPQETCFCDCLCTVQFFMIYLIICKAWRTSWQGLANPCLFWCNLFVISHILPITKTTLVHWSSSLARNKGDIGSLIIISCPWLRRRGLANPRLFDINAHYWTEAKYKQNIYSIFGRIYYTQDSNSTTSHILQKGLKFHQYIASFILQNGFRFHQ
jgi:hypothetical protein